MKFILTQKDEILNKKEALDMRRNEFNDMLKMHKKLSRAEEERMMDVMKSNSKIM